MKLHLAFVRPRTAELLIDGRQVCESRLSVARHPARLVCPGDRLLIKAGDGRALVTVTAIDRYSDLRIEDIEALRDLYGEYVDGPRPDPEYWARKARSRHAVFLWISQPQRVHVPRALLPSTRSAWVNDYQPDAAVRRLLSGADGSASNRHPQAGVPGALPVAPHRHQGALPIFGGVRNAGR